MASRIGGHKIERIRCDGPSRKTCGRPPWLALGLAVALLLGSVGQAAELPRAGTRVRVGVYDSPPKVFRTAEGGYAGIFPDLLARVAAKEGWSLEFVPGEWAVCLDRLERGEIDVMVDVAVSPDRAKRFAFSDQTVLVNWGVLYARPGFALSSLLDLRGRTLAVMQGSIHAEGEGGIRSLLQKLDVSCTVIELPSHEAVFEALRRGAADVGAVNRLFGAGHATRYGVTETPVLFNPTELRYAFPKAGRFGDTLRGVIDAALASFKAMPGAPIQRLVTDYLSRAPEEWGTKPGATAGAPVEFSLSPEEKRWLAAHPLMRLGVDPSWLPFEALDPRKGHLGIASDYTRLVADRLGVTLRPAEGLSWKQVLLGARNRQVDLLPAVSSTPERAAYLVFSDPYVSFPVVLVTRKSMPVPTDLAGLGQGPVALVDGYSIQELLRRDFPHVLQVPVADVDSGLLAVTEGRAAAYADNLPAVSHALERLELGDRLRISSPTPYTVDLRFGVRSDWPELVPILNKVLATIGPRRRAEINEYWITQRPSEERKMVRIRNQALWVIGGIAAAGVGILFHNRRLRVQVLQRERLARELERAKIETDLANERLKDLDRLKSMFIASMSHELRTPLNAIIGFSSILKDEWLGPLNPEQKENQEAILRAGRHLLALINDVIDISKIEAGVLETARDRFDLGGAVAEAVDLVRGAAENKGLELRVEAAPVEMHADRRRLVQCLVNLLGNAVKFTDEGRVAVTARTLAAGDGGGAWAEIAVADTGIGIREEDLPKVFGAFSRLVPAGDARRPGTGLGLYLTQKLVTETLGGELTVTSAYGQGSTFTMRLPLAAGG